MSYLNAFITGGIICVIGQLLIDRTKLTPARILVLFVTAGVILTGIGIYEPIVKWGGSGATVPLTGFGYALAKGVMKDIDKLGFLGIFTGGIKATAAGVSAAIFFSLIASLLFRAKAKT
jgi:stage V sporulation protein AE